MVQGSALAKDCYKRFTARKHRLRLGTLGFFYDKGMNIKSFTTPLLPLYAATANDGPYGPPLTSSAVRPSFTGGFQSAAVLQRADSIVAAPPQKAAKASQPLSFDAKAISKSLARARTKDTVAKTLTGPVVGMLAKNEANLALKLSQQATDRDIEEAAKTFAGRKALKDLVSAMNHGPSGAPTDQIARILKVLDPRYAAVLDDTLPPELNKSLKAAGVHQQKMRDGSANVRLDEYSITIDKMPPGVTPEQFLENLARNPNAAVTGAKFKDWADFSRRGSDGKRETKTGDVFDIRSGRVPGTNKVMETGPIAIRDKQPDKFVVTTVYDDKTKDDHPICGNREFGFRKNKDGSVTFYTLAADRRHAEKGLPGADQVSQYNQDQCWKEFIRALGKQIGDDGGQVRPKSETSRAFDAKDL